MSDDKLPYLPWFPRDFMSATRGWTLAERGLYRELLDVQWEAGAIPTKLDEIFEVVGARRREFTSAWKKVQRKFVDDGAGGLINRRLEQHREYVRDQVRRRAAAGRKGGQASASARSTAVERPLNDSGTNVERPLNDRSTHVEHPNPNPNPDPDSESSLPTSVGFDRSVAARTSSRGDDTPDVRSSRIPEAFHVDPSMLAWAVEKCPRVDVMRETEQFVAYWRGESGARSRKRNWTQAWRAWLLKSEKQEARSSEGNSNSGRARRGKPTHADVMRANADDD